MWQHSTPLACGLRRYAQAGITPGWQYSTPLARALKTLDDSSSHHVSYRLTPTREAPSSASTYIDNLEDDTVTLIRNLLICHGHPPTMRILRGPYLPESAPGVADLEPWSQGLALCSRAESLTIGRPAPLDSPIRPLLGDLMTTLGPKSDASKLFFNLALALLRHPGRFERREGDIWYVPQAS